MKRRHRQRGINIIAGIFAAGVTCGTAAEQFIPLPGEPGKVTTPNPIMELTNRAIGVTGAGDAPSLPDSITIENEGGEILFDNNNRIITYKGKRSAVRLRTDSGLDMQAKTVIVNLDKKVAELQGPVTVYMGDTLTLADSGTYDWENMRADIKGVRSKVSGIIVKGSSVRYDKDDKGKNFMQIQDAYVSTDDIEKPGSWIGAGELTVYPGEYGRVTRLSVAYEDHDVAIPIIGWFSFSHSLNLREGYLPHPGAKSIWGTYLLNQYGILLGNRRVENNIPTADYLMTTHLDYRTRRGVATGLDFEDLNMQKKYKSMKGLRLYYVADTDPNINPTDMYREPISKDRYAVKMSALWDLPHPGTDTLGHWTLGVNVEALSDRYFLRDYFEEEGHINERPDNTVKLTRRGKRSETTLLTRFAPNDFYTTDERFELSYYRARTAIGNTGINYETRNSIGAMRQYIPTYDRFMYKMSLEEAKDVAVREYYERLLNESTYFRINSTHEFTASFKLFNILDVTPKAGVGYTGYYSVGNVGADNRALGYAGVDLGMKLHRHFPNFRLDALGYEGLTHVVRPYLSFSHCNISSSNPLVPQVDTWSSIYGNSTASPMNLDLIGFTGIDGWGTWTIWRMGVQNTLTTTVDSEPRTLLYWDAFLDYNEENPNTNSKYSNLYSRLYFYPTRRLSLNLETQTPTVSSGEGYSQYNTYLKFQPVAYLEGQLGYRVIDNHPMLKDSSQIYAQANVRINDKYSTAFRWYWDVEAGRLPIQQYSVFSKTGAWYTGATLFLRNNGGKTETGFGISFTLGETASSLPINFF